MILSRVENNNKFNKGLNYRYGFQNQEHDAEVLDYVWEYTDWDTIQDTTTIPFLRFDANGDYVNAGTNNRGLTDQVTVEAWIKTTTVATTASPDMVVSKYNTSGFMLVMRDGKVTLDGRNGSDGIYKTVSSTTTVTDGNWHHIAGVVDASDTWKIYVDGVLENTSYYSLANPSFSNSTPLYLGRTFHSSLYYYAGDAKEISVWDRAKTANEIYYDYRRGNPNGSDPDLVAYFPLNEGTGSTINDLSPINIDGTRFNAAWQTQSVVDTLLVGTDSIRVPNRASQDFGARMYSNRLGRWLSIDPQSIKSPSQSPYNFVFNHPITHIDPDGEYPLIVITDEVTGYTVTKVYSKNNSNTIMIVYTYKMVVYDVDADGNKKVMGTYNVTRDGWYDIGEKGSPHYVNYPTEPKTKKDETNNADENYTATGWKSPTKIIQLEEMWAKERITEVADDGEEIPKTVKRSNPEIAKGVQIHVGGIYEMKDGTKKIGGTYGCFGVVPESQMISKHGDLKKLYAIYKVAQALLNSSTKKNLKDIVPSNMEMNNVNNSVNSAIKAAKKRGESNASDTKVTIQTRDNYEEDKN